jgi:hypothetical protein
MDLSYDLVQGAAHGDIAYGPGAAVLLGVLFHLTIRPIEFGFILYHFMVASALAFSGMVYSFGPLQAVLFAGSFNSALLISIVVYRLVLHRCRSIPGPSMRRVPSFTLRGSRRRMSNTTKSWRRCTNTMATLFERVSASCKHHSAHCMLTLY